MNNFSGTFNHQMDDRGRLRIPAKLRADLGDRPIIMMGADYCLDILSQSAAQIIFEKLDNITSADTVALKYKRKLLASLYTIEEDKQGRFLLPKNLRTYANLNKNVVFSGSGSKVNLWDESKWNEYICEDDTLEMHTSLGKYGI